MSDMLPTEFADWGFVRSECSEPIPVARLEAQPRTKTCSKKCSAISTKRVRREAANKWNKESRK